MNTQQNATKLVESGMSLRRMRTAFQVELLRLAEAAAGTSYKARAAALRVSDDTIRDLERRRKLQEAQPLPASARHSIRSLVAAVTQQDSLDYHKLLASLDREVIKAAVEQTKGRKTAAARILGIHRNMIPRLLVRTTVKRQLLSSNPSGLRPDSH